MFEFDSFKTTQIKEVLSNIRYSEKNIFQKIDFLIEPNKPSDVWFTVEHLDLESQPKKRSQTLDQRKLNRETETSKSKSKQRKKRQNHLPQKSTKRTKRSKLIEMKRNPIFSNKSTCYESSETNNLANSNLTSLHGIGISNFENILSIDGSTRNEPGNGVDGSFARAKKNPIIRAFSGKKDNSLLSFSSPMFSLDKKVDKRS